MPEPTQPTESTEENIVRTELTVPHDQNLQEGVASAPAFGVPGSAHPGNIYDGHKHAVDAKLTESGDPVMGEQNSSSTIRGQEPPIVVQGTGASSPTTGSQQTASGQHMEQNQTPAATGPEPVHYNQGTSSIAAPEPVPFYMQPNVGAYLPQPLRMGHPYWQQSANPWNYQNNGYGQSRQYPMLPYWNQLQAKGASEPQIQQNSRNYTQPAISWQSIGEDPLHGPTKVFRKADSDKKNTSPNEYKPSVDMPLAFSRTSSNGWSRRSSEESTARRPSFTSNTPSEFEPRYTSHQFSAIPRPQYSPPHAYDPGQFQVRTESIARPARYRTYVNTLPDRPCVNAPQYNSPTPREEHYDPCPCARCVERDCSIYIDGFPGFVHEDARDRVFDYFTMSVGPAIRTWVVKGSRGMIIL
ncbi:uncharacterized protein GGS22DRAFT_26259 [Annulohypoxylon maeteangense]|uniref:uncharacterized protein n=1 Tax=Annulohypoxylon maeteangense TaxID=1927788 RepID=UPI0020072B76|nr:uncharacterized protein GGS22DRAFT_26259 [Annulohypoxylon maeteangense]KAI0883809.1 hypothetical protein GGS22DRAFT_26259 [Annulohypoxylon maeteangense]